MGTGFPQSDNFRNDYGGNSGNPNAGFLNPAQAKGKLFLNSVKVQLDQYMALSQTFMEGTRRNAETLSTGHKSVWLMSRELDIINRILQTDNENLKKETIRLSNLIRKSEETPDIDYKSIVGPQDAYSAQLLDLVSESKAWE